MTADNILAQYKPITDALETTYGLPTGLLGEQLGLEVLNKKHGISPADNVLLHEERTFVAGLLGGLDKSLLDTFGFPISTLIKGKDGFDATIGNIKAIPNFNPKVILLIENTRLRSDLKDAYVSNCNRGFCHLLPADLIDATRDPSFRRQVTNQFELIAVVFKSVKSEVDAFSKLPLAERKRIFPESLSLSGRGERLSLAEIRNVFHYIYAHGPRALPNRAMQAALNERLPRDRQLKVDGYAGADTLRAKASADGIGLNPRIWVSDAFDQPERH